MEHAPRFSPTGIYARPSPLRSITDIAPRSELPAQGVAWWRQSEQLPPGSTRPSEQVLGARHDTAQDVDDVRGSMAPEVERADSSFERVDRGSHLRGGAQSGDSRAGSSLQPVGSHRTQPGPTRACCLRFRFRGRSQEAETVRASRACLHTRCRCTLRRPVASDFVAALGERDTPARHSSSRRAASSIRPRRTLPLGRR